MAASKRKQVTERRQEAPGSHAKNEHGPAFCHHSGGGRGGVRWFPLVSLQPSSTARSAFTGQFSAHEIGLEHDSGLPVPLLRRLVLLLFHGPYLSLLLPLALRSGGSRGTRSVVCNCATLSEFFRCVSRCFVCAHRGSIPGCPYGSPTFICRRQSCRDPLPMPRRNPNDMLLITWTLSM